VTDGNNVLDGSTGSNFLVGGSGHDTFFIDDRAATSDIWSTWVRGLDAHALNLWPKSMLYDGRIPGVCLSRGSLRRRFFDREDLLRHGYL
jgi:hypothetical protein